MSWRRRSFRADLALIIVVKNSLSAVLKKSATPRTALPAKLAASTQSCAVHFTSPPPVSRARPRVCPGAISFSVSVVFGLFASTLTDTRQRTYTDDLAGFSFVWSRSRFRQQYRILLLKRS